MTLLVVTIGMIAWLCIGFTVAVLFGRATNLGAPTERTGGDGADADATSALFGRSQQHQLRTIRAPASQLLADADYVAIVFVKGELI